MEFEDTLSIGTQKHRLWDLVSDPEVLASSVPGAKEIEKLSETRYKGTIERGVGGITLNMDGEVEITELNPPDNLSAKATGEDTKTNSRMDATALLEMEEVEEEVTSLSYHVDMEFTGRLATLGARIVKRKISSDIDTFFHNIQELAEDGTEGKHSF